MTLFKEQIQFMATQFRIPNADGLSLENELAEFLAAFAVQGTTLTFQLIAFP
jgi:hypothetical protein